jgi:hypothetical protein
MALKGSAFLALWNDFDPARDDEYNCWHTFEHVPERVGIAGILAGRRYVAMERSDRRYFTLYELASLAALDGPQYKDVVDRPTAWSASMRPSFRNFLRRPCDLVYSVGIGMAASIATFRCAVRSPVPMAEWHAVLRHRISEAGVTALHVGVVDVGARFPVSNAVSTDAAGVTPHVLLIEAVDRKALTAQCAAIAADLLATIDGMAEPEWETYDLAVVISEADLPQPKGNRQPELADLRRRWQP